MKTFFIRVISLACCLLFISAAGSAHAQAGRTTINYLIGFPTYDTSNFINRTSFLGFDLDLSMQVLNVNSEASLVLGFQRFKRDISNSTFTDPSSGAVLTADQERSLTSVPILVKWRFYPYTAQGLRWFLSAAAGGTYVERRFFVGSFDLSEYGWQFLLRPEGGASYMISNNIALEASVRYDYGVATSTLPTLGTVSIGLGLSTIF